MTTPAIITYSQSDVYTGLVAAEHTGMNSGNANGAANETGTDHDGWIQANLSTPQQIDHVVLGYDYLDDLPGNFGAAAFNGATLTGSLDATTWTRLATCDTGQTINGLMTIPVGADYQYLRVTAAPGQWLAVTEFEVWTTPVPAGMTPTTPPTTTGDQSTDQVISNFDTNEAARQKVAAGVRQALVDGAALRTEPGT
jgi:hypothetical protein